MSEERVEKEERRKGGRRRGGEEEEEQGKGKFEGIFQRGRRQEVGKEGEKGWGEVSQRGEEEE